MKAMKATKAMKAMKTMKAMKAMKGKQKPKVSDKTKVMRLLAELADFLIYEHEEIKKYNRRFKVKQIGIKKQFALKLTLSFMLKCAAKLTSV